MVNHTKVKDYMTQEVDTVSPDDTVRDVIQLIRRTGHDGFPVVRDRDSKVMGYISAADMLEKGFDEKVSKIMSRDVLVADTEMDMSDVARVIFRSGKSKLPVVDSNKHLRGIITNSDVIRSHIERTSPQKVWTLKKTLEAIHNIHVDVIREPVNIDELVPTQPKIYADELDGRIYELKKGLAEPIVVIKKPNKLILVDGHHRVVAAKKLGIKSMDAYVIPLGDEVHLGMEKTATSAGLHTLSDIKILDYAKHPLIEVTKRLKKNDENGLADINQ
ncbi:putative transcriptional regulator [Candidatus Methanoperedens nitroreducens]|uniref:Putative transcriptional regulator n=1 Tax=Candidatus Methanoperedens nitratireducens TaxID=1392998 RepID=A0A062VA21_9EURY|nr:CBS domain-containing protein [Candidatus Methanoperedens nitroreducens]KCZ72569.1 putative transcriptional regulator [Candidatus Methanoperedens nitroreducens]MDJ1423499.1 CBS domain-containing protein [Candidatus Methanoperedens sp.]